ncbi:MAG: Zn-ribbon domain-containing OB-fold protein [Dehalococcoidia bacterium]|nr:Zn-ribbon domain-containing OB-fold protein [Dehalococcoidia bacterium]
MPVDKVTQVAQTKPLHGEIPVYAQYTFGIAGEKFFRELKDNGRLMGVKCPECNLIYVPPRIYCERCFSELTEWLEIPNRGVVHTFTVSHIDLDGNRLKEPVIVALVKFDGVYGGLVHRLGRVEADKVSIGMPVEMVLKSKTKRVGSILDIDYFKPV